jgi:hypothetical protein
MVKQFRLPATNQELPLEPAGEEVAEAAAVACVIQNTAYNPAFWNTPSVQPHNNCYNYAMNFRSNTFAPIHA